MKMAVPDNIQIGLRANRPTSPSAGDIWICTDILGFYACAVAGTWRPILELDANGDIPHMRPKVASANLRHSHNAEIGATETIYTKYKTFTFTNGISGILRIAVDISSDPTNTAYAKVRKTVSGVTSDIGAEQSDSSTVYVTKTQDIDVGVLTPGDTIEMWVHRTGGASMGMKNFRIYYDNAPDTVMVAGVTTS